MLLINQEIIYEKCLRLYTKKRDTHMYVQVRIYEEGIKIYVVSLYSKHIQFFKIGKNCSTEDQKECTGQATHTHEYILTCVVNSLTEISSYTTCLHEGDMHLAVVLAWWFPPWWLAVVSAVGHCPFPPIS